MKVSAIIPNYNHNHLVRRAIESVVRNNCHPIVVDDGSDEDPYDLIKDLPITYLKHKKNKGLAATRNTAIKAAKTKWIIPLDADDELFDGVIDKMLKVDGDIIYGNLVWRDNGISLKPTPEIKTENFLVNNQLFGSSLYKKKVWKRVGGYWEEPKECYEDWDFWGRVAKASFKFSYIDLDVYLYKGGQDAMCARLGKERDKNAKLIVDHIKQWTPPS